MRKFIVTLILILSMLLLSSCTIGGSRTEMLNRSSDDTVANAQLEHVIEAIKSKDKDTVKSLFSKQALSEAVDFEDSMNDLFDFFQGNVDSWKKSSGPTVFESNDHGHKKKEICSYYYVNTDKQKYFFLLQGYSVDTDHPDNVGLYMVLVVKAEDEKNIYDGNKKILYNGDEKISHVGIYIPIK